MGIHFDNSVLLAQLSAYPEAAEQDRASAALAHVYRIQAMGFYVARLPVSRRSAGT